MTDIKDDDSDDLDLPLEAAIDPSHSTTDDTQEGIEITVQGLYDQLILDEELILTLDEVSFADLKRGLIGLKGKSNMKLEKNGLSKDSSKLTFAYLPCNDIGYVRVQISLSKKKSFLVAKIEKPSTF
jgi:hypothetical protein